MESSYQIPQKKFNFNLDDEDAFDIAKPIVSFKRMMNNNKKDLVDVALKALSEFIEKKSTNTHTQ